MSELRRVQVTFEYEVRRELDNELVVTGPTVHACMEIGEGRLCALPAWEIGSLRPLWRRINSSRGLLRGHGLI